MSRYLLILSCFGVICLSGYSFLLYQKWIIGEDSLVMNYSETVGQTIQKLTKLTIDTQDKKGTKDIIKLTAEDEEDPQEEGNSSEPIDIQFKSESPGGEDTFDPLDLSETELTVIQDLRKRRLEVEKREKQLKERERELSVIELRLDEKIESLRKLEDTIKSHIEKVRKIEEGRMSKLVKIYESMKPKEAASIFSQLDLNVLLEVLQRMSEKRIAPILAKMKPEEAKIITEKLVDKINQRPF